MNPSLDVSRTDWYAPGVSVLDDPIAYFLTWTTYGTHLHGDARGSVDEGYNRFGTPYLPQNSAIREYEEQQLRAEPLIFTDHMRDLVETTMRAHANIRRWRLRALNVRTNHVHVVLDTPPHSPETVEGQFKAWGTRRL